MGEGSSWREGQGRALSLTMQRAPGPGRIMGAVGRGRLRGSGEEMGAQGPWETVPGVAGAWGRGAGQGWLCPEFPSHLAALGKSDKSRVRARGPCTGPGKTVEGPRGEPAERENVPDLGVSERNLRIIPSPNISRYRFSKRHAVSPNVL